MYKELFIFELYIKKLAFVYINIQQKAKGMYYDFNLLRVFWALYVESRAIKPLYYTATKHDSHKFENSREM